MAAADSLHTSQLWVGIESRLRMQFQRLGASRRWLPAIVDERDALLEVLRSGESAAIEAALEEHIVTAAERAVDG